MKVLHLTPGLPWPPDSGGRIVMWNQLKAEARFAEVGVLSFVESPPDPAAIDAMKSVCREVRWVRRPKSLDGVVGGVRSLLSSMAMNLAKYKWPVFAQELAAARKEWQPDIVVAHHLHMGGYLLGIDDALTVLREHNVDSDLMARYADSLKNPAMAAMARRQSEQIRDTETRILPRVQQVMMITRDDETKMKEIAPGARMTVVPGAVDVSGYRAAAEPAGGAAPVIVTAGSLMFRPTGEGVVDFVEKVWPHVRKSYPAATFRIIGDVSPALRRKLTGPGIDVLGRVDDVAPHLDGAHAFVVPLNVGSGMRIRILEAMARQIPVISTPIGCEGIAVEDGRHILIAEHMDQMAAQIRRLLDNEVLARALRREGRRLVERCYSVEAVEELSRRIYRKAVPEAGGVGR